MSPRFPTLLLLAAAVLLTAATCNKPGQSTPAPAAQAPAAAPPPAAPGSGGTRAGAAPAAVLSGIPGMDFSVLSPAAQRELATVLTDEFCYCGCPHTVGSCLKTHAGCKHARRMALLAASAAESGAPGAEIIVSLSRYYQSFKEPRKAFKVDERMCHGSKDARVTLVEFADFECPFCGVARPMLEQFVQANPAKVRLCFLPFPLTNHPNAIPAGQAALFARDKGKFWEMHRLIFENQTQLSIPVLKELAGKLGLNAAELGKAIESGKYVDELTAAKDQGKAAGVDATPAIYVNGRKLLLDINPAMLGHAVDDEVEWQANKGAFAD